MKSTLKDGGGKNLLFESTIFTGKCQHQSQTNVRVILSNRKAILVNFYPTFGRFQATFSDIT